METVADSEGAKETFVPTPKIRKKDNKCSNFAICSHLVVNAFKKILGSFRSQIPGSIIYVIIKS